MSKAVHCCRCAHLLVLSKKNFEVDKVHEVLCLGWARWKAGALRPHADIVGVQHAERINAFNDCKRMALINIKVGAMKRHLSATSDLKIGSLAFYPMVEESDVTDGWRAYRMEKENASYAEARQESLEEDEIIRPEEEEESGGGDPAGGDAPVSGGESGEAPK